jgi:hypothetical protein
VEVPGIWQADRRRHLRVTAGSCLSHLGSPPPVAGGRVPCIAVVHRVSSPVVRSATSTDRPCRGLCQCTPGQPPA